MMSDFGVSVRSLPNATGLLVDAYKKWCDDPTDENEKALKKQVRNVARWAKELHEEFDREFGPVPNA